MSEIPAFDALKRGHVVLAPDLFKADDDATRPWVVINTEEHPFDGEQYIVMGLTTKAWYEARLPLDTKDYRHRQAPRDSSIVPHAIASLPPALMTEYVCLIRDGPLDRAVEVLVDYF